MPQPNFESVTLKRVLGAPIERVFSAWSKPEVKAQWFAPEGAICAVDGSGVKTGARESVMLRTPQGLQLLDITYCDVRHNARISYRCDTYVAGRHVAASAVVVKFEAHGGQTLITIREEIMHVVMMSAPPSPRTIDQQPFIAPEERLVARSRYQAPF